MLSSLYEPGDWICSGGCPQGADRFAEKFAKSEGATILIVFPDYKSHGRGAPIIRNTGIAKHSDIINACVMNPEDGIESVLERKTGGTEDTLRKFIKLKEHNINKIHLV